MPVWRKGGSFMALTDPRQTGQLDGPKWAASNEKACVEVSETCEINMRGQWSRIRKDLFEMHRCVDTKVRRYEHYIAPFKSSLPNVDNAKVSRSFTHTGILRY